MTEARIHETDRRARRSRKAILDALIRLIFSKRYGAIRTAELIAEAGVGRSTFYEHFRSKDDVLLAAIDPIFVPLAAAASGHASPAGLRATLDHMWAQRMFARVMFEPPLGSKLQRKLAAQIAERLAEGPDGVPVGLVATGLAARQLALLKAWLAGEEGCSATDLARHLAGR